MGTKRKNILKLHLWKPSTIIWHVCAMATDWQRPTEAEGTCRASQSNVTSPFHLGNSAELSWCSQHSQMHKTTNTRRFVLHSHPKPIANQGQPLGPARHTICLGWLTFGPRQKLRSRFRGGPSYLHSVFVFYNKRAILFFLINFHLICRASAKKEI